MRDLGLMGESTFTLWCADAGLVPNGSQVDKTGWDFFVEFPFNSDLSPREIHRPACECKVQVKATDKNDRKLQITLSNLRRLITAQMPAFFVFIEFDRKEIAQRAFVVHVDNDLISKVLRRIHEIHQSSKEHNLNKRTMIIHYDDSNLLDGLNGSSLKNCFLRYIGNDVSKYIASKKSYLESTGYENGFAQVTFTTEGEENFKDLIDVSLGIKKEVEIANFKSFNSRFGILSDLFPNRVDSCKLMMPQLKPTAEGKIRFKEDKFSAGLSFECRLYVSPFYEMAPDRLKKIRIEGDFFDLKFSPLVGTASYSFSFGEGVRLEVGEFRNAIKLLELLSKSEKKFIAELLFDGFPKLDFKVGCNDVDVDLDFSKELAAFDSAVKIIRYFEVSDMVDISFEEISRFGDQIQQMELLLSSPPSAFRVDFIVDGDGYDPSKKTVYISVLAAPVGSHIFGAIMAMIGDVERNQEGKYRLNVGEVVVEQRIVSEKDEVISHEDLVAAIEVIEKKYGGTFEVVTMFDKTKEKTIKSNA